MYMYNTCTCRIDYHIHVCVHADPSSYYELLIYSLYLLTLASNPTSNDSTHMGE